MKGYLFSQCTTIQKHYRNKSSVVLGFPREAVVKGADNGKMLPVQAEARLRGKLRRALLYSMLAIVYHKTFAFAHNHMSNYRVIMWSVVWYEGHVRLGTCIITRASRHTRPATCDTTHPTRHTRLGTRRANHMIYRCPCGTGSLTHLLTDAHSPGTFRKNQMNAMSQCTWQKHARGLGAKREEKARSLEQHCRTLKVSSTLRCDRHLLLEW